MLTEPQIHRFRSTGHVTVTGLFREDEIDRALVDLDEWSRESLTSMRDDERRWFLERQDNDQIPILRKLDHPVYLRSVFRSLAENVKLNQAVRQLIGGEVCLFFSQVFMKPSERGGPKPVHQDNFYFGPDDVDATLTAWVALDDATIENGCLHYGNVHQDHVLPHFAPRDEPFNLQIDPDAAAMLKMRPEPVPRGGVSFHHGNTPHQSPSNRSSRPRRAAAFHYLRRDSRLVHPALPYDWSLAINVA